MFWREVTAHYQYLTSFTGRNKMVMLMISSSSLQDLLGVIFRFASMLLCLAFFSLVYKFWIRYIKCVLNMLDTCSLFFVLPLKPVLISSRSKLAFCELFIALGCQAMPCLLPSRASTLPHPTFVPTSQGLLLSYQPCIHPHHYIRVIITHSTETKNLLLLCI